MMEKIVTEPQEHPPRITVIETEKKKPSKEKSFEFVYDHSIQTPEKMSPKERQSAFQEAYSAIVGNEDLEMLVVRAFTSQERNVLYAELMNTLTTLCLSLSDVEIENIVRKFKEGLMKRLRTYASTARLSEQDAYKLQQSVISDTLSAGVKPVVHFIRAREMLHRSSPETFPAFYFEYSLDAYHRIDLIEILDTPRGIVIHLIQVKSYEYKPEDITRNVASHRRWVNEFMTPVDEYESKFSIEPENSEQFKDFFTKVENISSILEDILTGTVVSDENVLYEKLGIGDLPKVEQIWILEQYLPALKMSAEQLYTEYNLDQADIDRISGLIQGLEKRLEKAIQRKKGLRGVHEVRSLCAVEGRVVNDAVVFQADSEKKQKAIKISK